MSGHWVESGIEQVGVGPYQFRLAGVVGLLNLADAAEMMLISILNPTLACEWGISAAQQAWLTTTVFVGMGLGAVVLGWYADSSGRAAQTRLSAAIVVACGLGSAMAPGFASFVLLRFGVGFGMGGSFVSNVLLVEGSPAALRARVVVLNGVCWGFGSVYISTLAGFVMVPGLGWRWLVGLASAPTVLALLLIEWEGDDLESARWFAASGQNDKAVAVLERAARMNWSGSDGGAQAGRTLQLAVPTGAAAAAEGRGSGEKGSMAAVVRSYRETFLKLCVVWFCVAATHFGMVLATTEEVADMDSQAHARQQCEGSYGKHNPYKRHAAVRGLNDTSVSALYPHCAQALTSQDFLDLRSLSLAEVPGEIFLGK